MKSVKPPVRSAAKNTRERSPKMSRATKQYHDTDPAEQLSLFSYWQLAALQSSSASLARKGELASHKARRLQDVEKRFIKIVGAIQSELPGILPVKVEE
jgi:hypothetical protein